MRSISEILNLALDGEITTPEEAAELIEEEVTDRIMVCHISAAEARSTVLENIGYATGYMTPENADRINDLFNTEHPVWGRTHPTAEEALRLGIEYGSRGVKEMERPIEERKSKRKAR
jgi:hypothetical protein